MELEVMRHSDVICRNLVQVPMHNTQMCASGVSEEDYANPYHVRIPKIDIRQSPSLGRP